jgi:hypothetical protein
VLCCRPGQATPHLKNRDLALYLRQQVDDFIPLRGTEFDVFFIDSFPQITAHRLTSIRDKLYLALRHTFAERHLWDHIRPPNDRHGAHT